MNALNTFINSAAILATAIWAWRAHTSLLALRVAALFADRRLEDLEEQIREVNPGLLPPVTEHEFSEELAAEDNYNDR